MTNLANNGLVKSAMAGLAGGLMMAAYASAAMGVTGRGFFTPVNLIAALFPPYRPVVSGFHPMAALIGLAVHLLVSAAWAAAFGWLAGRAFAPRFQGAWSRFAIGLGLGVIAWAVTGVRLGPDLDPALRMMPAATAFLSHLAYGVGTAMVSRAWASPRNPGVPDRAAASLKAS